MKTNKVEEDNKEDSEKQIPILNLPREIFNTFKSHNRRNIVNSNDSFYFIVENELDRKKKVLHSEVETTTQRLFKLSNCATFYNGLIQTNINPSLKEYLTNQQKSLYIKCLKYIKTNKLPNYYSYYVLDFLVSTGDKFLHLNEESVFNSIAVRFLLNNRSVLAGASKPKLRKSIYSTLPKAFSPLFFQTSQFVGTVFRDKKIRKDFLECLVHTFSEQMKSSTQRILQSHNKEELDYLINQVLHNIENTWWVPKSVLTKFNQTKIYIQNTYSNSSSFFEFVVLNYISYSSNFGFDTNRLKDMNPQKIIKNIQKHIRKVVHNTTFDNQNGWSIFDSVPEYDGCIYKALTDLDKTLSKNTVNNNKQRKIHSPRKKSSVKKAKLKHGIFPNMFKFDIA